MSVGGDALDLGHEPGEPDGEGDEEVGGDSPGAVRDWIAPRNHAVPSRYRLLEGRRGGQEAGSELVCLGACGAGANLGALEPMT